MLRRLGLVVLLLLSTVNIGGVGVHAQTSAEECITSSESVETGYADITAVVAQSPNRSDTVRITYQHLPRNARLEVQLPSAVTITRSDGFSQNEGSADLRYTGEGQAVLEYRIGKPGVKTQFANGSTWLFAPAPTHIGTGVQLEFRRTGYAGNHFLYIGNYTEHKISLGCHEVSLINAQAGDLPAQPRQIMQALKHAATEFDTGHKYEEVSIFLTPKFAHPPNPGFARGSDVWVTKSTSLYEYQSYTRIVLHEYIHTRQTFGSGSIGGMGWVKEASADYFSYQFALDMNAVSNQTYNRWLRNGSQTKAVLTNRSTWQSTYVKYNRGGAYMAILDQRIRANSNRSLEAVIRHINDNGQPDVPVLLQRSMFLEIVENASTPSVRSWANRTMDSPRDFDVNRATLPVSSESFVAQLSEDFEQRTAKKPYATVTVALLMGVVLTTILDEYTGESDEASEGDEASSNEE